MCTCMWPSNANLLYNILMHIYAHHILIYVDRPDMTWQSWVLCGSPACLSVNVVPVNGFYQSDPPHLWQGLLLETCTEMCSKKSPALWSIGEQLDLHLQRSIRRAPPASGWGRRSLTIFFTARCRKQRQNRSSGGASVMPSSRWHRGYDTAVILWHPVSKFFLGVPRKFCHISTHTHTHTRTYIYIYNIHTHTLWVYVYIYIYILYIEFLVFHWCHHWCHPCWARWRPKTGLALNARLFDPETILKALSSKTSLIILHRIWGYPYEDQ